MFCYQCQETAHNTGCKVRGVCGKDANVADLQDLFLYLLKGISRLLVKLRDKNVEIPEVDYFIINGLFMTITNANFNPQDFIDKIRESYIIRDKVITKLATLGETINSQAPYLKFRGMSLDDMEEMAQKVGIMETQNENVRSLQQLLIYGIKGIAAYAEHAFNLGYKDKDIFNFIQYALGETINPTLTEDDLLGLVMQCGEYGVKTMALLDKANTSTYGNPEITEVELGVRNNPGILISGHDLKDLEDLLEETRGTGIDIYTHCEMLPAQSYPFFKKYDNFAGNYGGSWWTQQKEFETFNGPVLFTSNCIVPPRSNAPYADKVFTTGAAGFPGFPHIPQRKDGERKDFSTIINKAKKCSPPIAIENGKLIAGFAHSQVEALSDKIVESIKSGAIKKFFVMAGCDGRMKDRTYYTEFAEALPKDTIILTAGCAKFRYNKLVLDDINGIPRVLDAGQCNDSYSLVVIALKLKEIFKLADINDLPIDYNIAWYEQKAVIVFLALLSLGIQNIHLGPTLPAFLSPRIMEILIAKFNISGIGTVKKDIHKFLG